VKSFFKGIDKFDEKLYVNPEISELLFEKIP
jgi:hypothetical protein